MKTIAIAIAFVLTFLAGMYVGENEYSPENQMQLTSAVSPVSAQESRFTDYSSTSVETGYDYGSSDQYVLPRNELLVLYLIEGASLQNGMSVADLAGWMQTASTLPESTSELFYTNRRY